MQFPPPFEVSLEKIARSLQRLQRSSNTGLPRQKQLGSEDSSSGTHQFSGEAVDPMNQTQLDDKT